MTLAVHSLVGPVCMTLRDGEKVFEKIYPELKAGREVELDFSSVGVSTLPFFNAAIGRLLRDIRPDVLNENLHVTNLNDVAMTVLGRVIENSKEYYSNPALQEAVDEILSAQAEG
jgi:hypothetical protein